MGKIAVIYISRYGTTKKVATMIADGLSDDINEVVMFSLKDTPYPKVADFDHVILGSSIYMGKPGKRMKKFCKANEAMLMQKYVSLFVCGMIPGEERKEAELRDAYPDSLLRKSHVAAFLGGEFLLEKMNCVKRLAVKKIAIINRSVSAIDMEAVDDFINWCARLRY
jgi:menaquinone-dependent protoporphyrinogen oxidase